MKKDFRIAVLFMLVISLLASGCSKNKSSNVSRETGSYYTEEYDYDDYFADGMVEMAYAAEESAAYSKAVPAAAANAAEVPEQKRMIQKSASINIQVMDPLESAEKIAVLTDQMGGFVVSSSNGQEYYNGDIYLPRANLTIRVPAERLNEMLEFIENLTSDSAKYVSNKRVYGVDITSDYVDTNSRLTSLEKTRDKLYEIMDTAENAEEALEVYNRISEVESDIEVYKGQIKYMEESVALSSIDIQINSIKPAPIHTVQTWSLGEVFSDAFENLLDIGKSVIEFIINFIIVVIPVLILISLPVILIVLIFKKVIKSKKTQKNTTDEAKVEDTLTEVKKN
ncbi:MAG: DUF4349 domain-containing protein [Flexilinea sp.]|nr:DUF4349 domain-containing protein [Flexilinea sp.]